MKRQIREKCISEMGSDIFFNTCIREATAVAEARAVGVPISYYKPTAPVSLDYQTLTSEIIKQIKERTK